MLKKFQRYLIQSFVVHLVGLCAATATMAWLLEVLTKEKSPSVPLSHFFLQATEKIPFILHKGLFFLVFCCASLSLWRLLRFRELTALHSVGISLRQVLGPMMVGTTLLAMGDLLYLDPLSQYFVSKASPVSSGGAHRELLRSRLGWHKFPTPQGSLIVHFSEGGESDWYFFSLHRTFLKHIHAGQWVTEGATIVLQDAWFLQPGTPPRKEATVRLPAPVDFGAAKTTTHPALMSFQEIQSRLLQERGVCGQAVYLRLAYLIASMVLVILAVPFAAGVIVGHATGKKRSLWVFFGILACFFGYFTQEYIYFISLSSPYTFSSSLFFFIPMCFFCCSILLWTEKNQW